MVVIRVNHTAIGPVLVKDALLGIENLEIEAVRRKGRVIGLGIGVIHPAILHINQFACRKVGLAETVSDRQAHAIQAQFPMIGQVGDFINQLGTIAGIIHVRHAEIGCINYKGFTRIDLGRLIGIERRIIVVGLNVDHDVFAGRKRLVRPETTTAVFDRYGKGRVCRIRGLCPVMDEFQCLEFGNRQIARVAGNFGITRTKMTIPVRIKKQGSHAVGVDVAQRYGQTRLIIIAVKISNGDLPANICGGGFGGIVVIEVFATLAFIGFGAARNRRGVVIHRRNAQINGTGARNMISPRVANARADIVAIGTAVILEIVADTIIETVAGNRLSGLHIANAGRIGIPGQKLGRNPVTGLNVDPTAIAQILQRPVLR